MSIISRLFDSRCDVDDGHNDDDDDYVKAEAAQRDDGATLFDEKADSDSDSDNSK